jgi:hypothetical protein
MVCKLALGLLNNRYVIVDERLHDVTIYSHYCCIINSIDLGI